jgi:hypothetical protein
MILNIYYMIVNVWKPKTKLKDGKQIVIYYTLVDISDIYLSGASNLKVVYKCDSNSCKNSEKLFSLNRQHLNENRSKTVNEKIQICRSCQMSGDKNPKFGDNRSWLDSYGEEKTLEMKNNLKIRSLGDKNPSKNENVKIKKNQIIINFNNVSEYVSKFNFRLESIDGDNKFAKLSMICNNNHKIDIKYINFKVRKICRYCYYDSIRIPFDVIENFEKYSRTVRSLTRFTFNKNKDLIDIEGLKKLDSEKYHIDHIYSISDGFLNNVDPKIIASVNNLRVISKIQNLKKGKISEQSLSELLDKFNS